MFILISSENRIKNEGAICDEFFQCGLPLLHLRKPGEDKSYFRDLLKTISPIYHPKISLHQHHDLQEEFKIGGIHFTEKYRNSFGEKLTTELEKLEKSGMRTSSSFHSLKDLSKTNFDYCFLSPVFDSISKSNYPGHKTKVYPSQKKIIALGGIRDTNIKETKDLGYSGVAVLGSVWNSSNPIKAFEKLLLKYQEVYPQKAKVYA